MDICYTCKGIIKLGEPSKTVPIPCPDAGTGIYQYDRQCLVTHMGTVHVDCPEVVLPDNKPLSETALIYTYIEQLKQRIEELEELEKRIEELETLVTIARIKESE